MACCHSKFVVHRSGQEHEWSGTCERGCTCEPALICPICQSGVLHSCVITAGEPTVAELRKYARTERDRLMN